MLKLKSAVLLGVCQALVVQTAIAQEVPASGGQTPAGAAVDASTTTTSSSSSSYRKGYGFKDSNVFAPKYKQRLQNWREQIELGLTRGFLKQADADRLRLVLDRLTTMEADMASKNYPKAETDNMEQEFNAFNVDISQAMQPVPPPAAPAATPTASPPTGSAPPAAAPATPAKPVAAPKPAAPPAAKKPAPSKRPPAKKKRR